jgi:hypothetical protein
MKHLHALLALSIAVTIAGVPTNAQNTNVRRGALVRLQPAGSPSIVRVIGVPADRVVAYRSGLFVLPPGSVAGVRVEGLSAGFGGDPHATLWAVKLTEAP